jgi:hypothetical protein
MSLTSDIIKDVEDFVRDDSREIPPIQPLRCAMTYTSQGLQMDFCRTVLNSKQSRIEVISEHLLTVVVQSVPGDPRLLMGKIKPQIQYWSWS